MAFNYNVSVDIELDDIIEDLDYETGFELIKNIDLYNADWDFTFELITYFIGILKESSKFDDIKDMIQELEKKYNMSIVFHSEEK
jgi:hypothetical protein